MRYVIRTLLFLNVLIEIALPAAGFFFLHRLVVSGDYLAFDANGIFPPVLIISTTLTIPFYLWTVFQFNLRTFPRIPWKALFAFFVPLAVLIALLFVEKLTLDVWVAVAGPLLYGSILLAAMLAPIREARLMIFHRTVRAPFIFISLFSLCTVNILAAAVLIDRADTTTSIFIWLFAFMVLTYFKSFRSGWKNYAKRGYRPNVAAIVMNEKGEVLLCERVDKPGNVQTVQGGIDPGETPRKAIARELQEELGIWPEDYRIVQFLEGSKRYDWPPNIKRRLRSTGFVGQEQYFFLVEVSSKVKFDLNYHHREFRKVWWGSPTQMLALAWKNKRPGIEAALKGFKLL